MKQLYFQTSTDWREWLENNHDKENGVWLIFYRLEANPKAKATFEQLAPTYQKQYLGWIIVAKRQETRQKRIRESIKLLEKGQKLGLK